MARRKIYLPVMIAAAVAVACALTLVVAGGVALAVSKVGTNGRDTLTGTNKNDFLSGKGGGDDVYGWDGTDELQGGPGKDFLFGGRCADFRSDGSCADFPFSSGNKNLVGGPATTTSTAAWAPTTWRARRATTCSGEETRATPR
jgi:Ca2+-binding RTX toxin-like protein